MSYEWDTTSNPAAGVLLDTVNSNKSFVTFCLATSTATVTMQWSLDNSTFYDIENADLTSVTNMWNGYLPGSIYIKPDVTTTAAGRLALK